jgi:hypothetical protein
MKSLRKGRWFSPSHNFLSVPRCETLRNGTGIWFEVKQHTATHTAAHTRFEAVFQIAFFG